MISLPKRFLDTVALKQTYTNLPAAEKFLSDKWFKANPRNSGKLTTYILNVPQGSRLPRMTLSQTPDYIWHLYVEASLSAWQKGSNIQLCDEVEIQQYFNLLDEYVSENIDLKFNAFTAKVSRMDVAEDIPVGEENVTGIIKEVSKTTLNRFNRHNINDETVYFKNVGKGQNIAITFYDKFKQASKEYPNAADLYLARGILRHEVSLRKVKIEKVVKELNLTNRTAEVLLTQEVAEHILNYGKETVYYDLSLKNKIDWIFELATRLPITKAIQIIGFVILLRRFGCDFYNISTLDFNKRTYQRYIKNCFDNHINPFE